MGIFLAGLVSASSDRVYVAVLESLYFKSLSANSFFHRPSVVVWKFLVYGCFRASLALRRLRRLSDSNSYVSYAIERACARCGA